MNFEYDERLARQIESFFPKIGEPGTGSLAITGEPFKTFAYGIKFRKKDTPEDRAADLAEYRERLAQKVVSAILEDFGDVVERMTLYWREKPHYRTEEEDGYIKLALWTRLLISDKTPVSLVALKPIKEGEAIEFEER